MSREDQVHYRVREEIKSSVLEMLILRWLLHI